MSLISLALMLVRRKARFYHLQPLSLAVSLSRNGMASKPIWAYLVRQSAREERDTACSSLFSSFGSPRRGLAGSACTASACRGSQRWSNAPAFDFQSDACRSERTSYGASEGLLALVFSVSSGVGAFCTASSKFTCRLGVSIMALVCRDGRGSLPEACERGRACCDCLDVSGGNDCCLSAGVRMTVNSCA